MPLDRALMVSFGGRNLPSLSLAEPASRHSSYLQGQRMTVPYEAFSTKQPSTQYSDLPSLPQLTGSFVDSPARPGLSPSKYEPTFRNEHTGRPGTAFAVSTCPLLPIKTDTISRVRVSLVCGNEPVY
jgi:hypothetical protein